MDYKPGSVQHPVNAMAGKHTNACAFLFPLLCSVPTKPEGEGGQLKHGVKEVVSV